MTIKKSPTIDALGKEIYDKKITHKQVLIDDWWVRFSPAGYDKCCAEKRATEVFLFKRGEPESIMGIPFEIQNTQEEDFIVHISKKK